LRAGHHRVVALALAAALGLGCSRPFFHPEPGLRGTPDQIGFAYQDVAFESEDGVHLSGWLVRARPGPARATIVFLHGNAENVSTHLGNVLWLCAAGFDVFLFDYRGFGLSGGSPDLTGVRHDAEAALRAVRSQPGVDPERIVVFGQSLGASIALAAVASTRPEVPVVALIADSAVSDWRLIARQALARWWLTWPLQWPLSLMAPEEPNPLRAAASLGDLPLLFVTGDADEVVPPEHSRRLQAAAGRHAELWIAPGASHIATFANPLWRLRLVVWIEGVLDRAHPSAVALAGRIRRPALGVGLPTGRSPSGPDLAIHLRRRGQLADRAASPSPD
jgi:uncharacterized protein